MTRGRVAAITAVGLGLLGVGCAEPLVPVADDETLLAQVQADGYPEWARPSTREERTPVVAPHGGFVDIYINAVVEADLAMTELPEGLLEWSEGATIVLEGHDAMEGGELLQVAVMQKRHGVWTWEQYDGDSTEPRFSGRPDVCRGCHGGGEDFVRSFRLPDPPKE